MAHRSVLEPGELRARGIVAGRVALAAAVTALIVYYAGDFARDPGLASPWSAAWLWAASLAWIVVTIGILGVHLTFRDGYYRARTFERSGRLYRALGVRQALKLMPHGEYQNRLARRLRSTSGPITGPDSARRWLAETRSKEGAHLAHLLLTLPAVAVFAAGGWSGSAATVLALDVVADLYPVMGQRYNRIRLERMFARQSRSGGGGAGGSAPPERPAPTSALPGLR